MRTIGECVVATYPVRGPAEIRFWVSRLLPTEALADFDMTRLLHEEEQRSTKVELEVNFGFFKVKLA